MSFHYQGIDHVQLAAPKGCEEEARQFYGSILGMPEVPKPANLLGRGGVWFVCGKQEVHIGVQNDFIPAKKAHPAFQVTNLLALKDRLSSYNIAIKEDEPILGRNRFFVDDPFGNRLEFLEFIDSREE